MFHRRTLMVWCCPSLLAAACGGRPIALVDEAPGAADGALAPWTLDAGPLPRCTEQAELVVEGVPRGVSSSRASYARASSPGGVSAELWIEAIGNWTVSASCDYQLEIALSIRSPGTTMMGAQQPEVIDLAAPPEGWKVQAIASGKNSCRPPGSCCGDGDYWGSLERLAGELVLSAVSGSAPMRLVASVCLESNGQQGPSVRLALPEVQTE